MRGCRASLGTVRERQNAAIARFELLPENRLPTSKHEIAPVKAILKRRKEILP